MSFPRRLSRSWGNGVHDDNEKLIGMLRIFMVDSTAMKMLTAINIGTTAMNKASESKLKEAIMGFVSEYGMLGLMTALPTTPDFITYEAVYLPKNHFIGILNYIGH